MYYEDLLENVFIDENDINKNNINIKDKHFHSLRKNKHKIKFYSSGDTGSKIKDAITGKYTKHIVGSADENLYFSVMLCDGSLGQTPYKIFYSTPEEYEKNNLIELSDEVKNIWKEKYKNYIKNKKIEETIFYQEEKVNENNNENVIVIH